MEGVGRTSHLQCVIDHRALTAVPWCFSINRMGCTVNLSTLSPDGIANGQYGVCTVFPSCLRSICRCRCGAVVFPVMPTYPTICPGFTVSPSFTFRRLKCP